MKSSRRNFLKLTGIGLLASQAPLSVYGKDIQSTKLPVNHLPFQLGIASYSLRKFSLEETIDMTDRLGISKLALKSMHLPLDSSQDEIQQAVEKINLVDIELYGAGVIYMKSIEEVDNAFNYAKTAGLRTIIGVPSHELLNYCSEKVESFNINMAIHNHGPGDDQYPSPESVYSKIKDLHPGMGLCVDIGHTERIGQDPTIETAKFMDRVHDIHIKDVDKSEAKGKTVEIGRGVIDIPGFLKMLIEKKYSGIVSFEYEKDGDDPLPGLAESVGYVRGVLKTLA